ncbi:succinate dehydrogenase/fumarate reductase iron-sulfur subunit [Aureibacter tunicatorum]|uniref:Succinate dehydrogenase / fumarate reductase iron-sulfur subunit n=1 Tax=Aureibacter tunicatorum TaxID=866807 RepID=A0AAE4BTK7_9BACT|nr:succinate dehydrogenase/fumarate reductase iron-sulfur subunit [Aureibacter tunicatorum]MDR6239742.1 succinate dehydrogenase / fumarate reductase iron-sulfur subunit [Aureibacter tunicatorum]BDD04218.1 succinate dehydrogenase [Aureibacter tunicatorum]
MDLTLKVWRQKDSKSKGQFKEYKISNISEGSSFLEMLDILNEDLVAKNEDPIHFDSDCREGICGMCSLFINGRPHGPEEEITVCQLHMRTFNDGDTITIEPWRAKAFPVLKDLVVDRSSFERIIQAGGHVGVNTGGIPDANAIPIPKEKADLAMDAAACIGCGACVAACKNASAMLFVSAKVSQLALLPQGNAERTRRVTAMVNQMDSEGFGACTNTGACEAECPKGISLSNIARMNREYYSAKIGSRQD